MKGTERKILETISVRALHYPHKPLFATHSGFSGSVEKTAHLSSKAQHRANVGETANSKTIAGHCIGFGVISH